MVNLFILLWLKSIVMRSVSLLQCCKLPTAHLVSTNPSEDKEKEALKNIGKSYEIDYDDYASKRWGTVFSHLPTLGWLMLASFAQTGAVTAGGDASLPVLVPSIAASIAELCWAPHTRAPPDPSWDILHLTLSVHSTSRALYSKNSDKCISLSSSMPTEHAYFGHKEPCAVLGGLYIPCPRACKQCGATVVLVLPNK